MENQQKARVSLQPTEPNTLYQEPTNHARRMPMEQNKREQFIIRRIGGTTYKVRVVFNESGGETMEERYAIRWHMGMSEANIIQTYCQAAEKYHSIY